MKKEILLSIISFFLAWTLVESDDSTVEQKLKEDANLSQFYDLLISNAVSKFILKYRPVTIFAPTNAAFQRYLGTLDESLVLYHMINLAKTIDQLGSVVTSELEGNPPLWITIRKDVKQDDVFINNAKILLPHSNYVAMNNGKRQVLHVIDEVLTAVVPSKTTTSPLYNPNALQFLFQSENIDIGTHRLRNFGQRVNQTNKREMYNVMGKHTFFIPVDEGFVPSQCADMLDDKVIDGHVIPNHVLFSSSAPYDTPFETLAFGDNLKVTVTFRTEANSSVAKLPKVFIISNTLLGDSKHTAGVVQAEIVKANIPVKNGVIHLIQRPLMIVDMTS